MKQEQLDISNTTNNTDAEQNKEPYLIKREPLPNTNFWAIQSSNGTCFIAMGRHKVSREWETEGDLLLEAENVLINDHWLIHGAVCALVAELVWKEREEGTI